MKFKSKYLVDFLPDQEPNPFHSGYAVASDMYTQIFDTKFTWATPYYMRLNQYKKLREIINHGENNEHRIPDNLLFSVVFGACVTNKYGAIIIFPTKTIIEKLKNNTEFRFSDVLTFEFKSQNFSQNIRDFKDFTNDFLGCIRKEDITSGKLIKRIGKIK